MRGKICPDKGSGNQHATSPHSRGFFVATKTSAHGGQGGRTMATKNGFEMQFQNGTEGGFSWEFSGGIRQEEPIKNRIFKPVIEGTTLVQGEDGKLVRVRLSEEYKGKK